jgi:hypothetical protein
MKKPSMDAYPESWLPKSARPDQKSEPEPLNLHARIQDFLVRIQPLSPDLRSHGRTRALALQKLHRICAREVRNLKAKFTLATVKYYLSQYRDAFAPLILITWFCAPDVCDQASASATWLSTRKKPVL